MSAPICCLWGATGRLGGADADTLVAGNGRNRSEGPADIMSGNSGDDSLSGEGGDDSL